MITATIALNWKEDGELDKKQNEENSTIPYHAYLQKNIRVARLIFVIAFMLRDAVLTVKNVRIIFNSVGIILILLTH